MKIKGLEVFILLLCIGLSISPSFAQKTKIEGTITDVRGNILPGASVFISEQQTSTVADSSGHYRLERLRPGTYFLEASFLGYETYRKKVQLDSLPFVLDIHLHETRLSNLKEVVISGTMKEVSKLESAVPVEVYTSGFFKANPTPSIFDALQTINGVRPQLNCNICSTGDIHINGLEGPYTMVLIDGMPLVSGLSTVYGLSGIPQSLIDRIEIVKGPASTLYGSEAVGGLINIITRKPENAPLVSADLFVTGWGEANTDLSVKFAPGKNVQSLLGINYFNYRQPADHNADNFTDITIQDRVSVFNKWSFNRKDKRIFSLGSRYVYEDRWGGEMQWNRKNRGGSEVYGESIYTKRWELMGTYQLPLKEKLIVQFSANGHQQNSVYGNIPYIADQYIGFAQLSWFKHLGAHELLSGLTYRYTYYDDNTPATGGGPANSANNPSRTALPGIFLQDEIRFNEKNTLLVGLRYDQNSVHGSILTPRLNYKWNSQDKNTVLRLSLGNGYRVANVFTEDHAALTGSREVVFRQKLRPETSWNVNLNAMHKIYFGKSLMGLDATIFHTYFNNKIVADYDEDPNQIIYENLSGYAVSQGISLNIDWTFDKGLKIMAGGTAMNVFNKENGKKTRQAFTEQFSGTWNIGYSFKTTGLTLDYTGNVYGPMRLPLLSDTDPRSPYSPWWSIQNIQLSKKIGKKMEVYSGVKNLMNWTPNRGNPFIIARSHDPFDKQVEFDASGRAVANQENPYGLTFDPSYVYGPNQGRRGFLGLRYHLFR